MARKLQAEKPATISQEDQIPTIAEATAVGGTDTGPTTPATGTGGAADAGEVAAATTPAEAAPEASPAATTLDAAQVAEVKADIFGASVLIKGPAKGRWRAGRFFGPEPVEVPIGDLTEDQQRAIAADPELTVILKT